MMSSKRYYYRNNELVLTVTSYGETKVYGYFQNGKLHRDSGPAVVYSNGSVKWYRRGKLHREDGPVKDFVNGRKEWWKNDQLHREGGPAVIISGGVKYFYENGKKLDKFPEYLATDFM